MEARCFAMETCQTKSPAAGLFRHRSHPNPWRSRKNLAPLGKHQTSAFYSCLVAFAAPCSSTQLHKLDLEPRQHHRMFILGMGYVGQFFSQFLKSQDRWTVTGTCTSLMKKKQLEDRGFDVCLFDANEPECIKHMLNTLKSYTHVIVSIPPRVAVGDPILQHEQLLRSGLMNRNLQWLGYLSSTSVYGDCGGSFVDEDYLTCPTSDTAKLRLAAEQGWLNLGHDLGISTNVFRLGGIYGPGRRSWLLFLLTLVLRSWLYHFLCLVFHPFKFV
uniref:Uncharacterized protein LOC105633845 n=1 Tax=Rhizophora mucronata TaxID=61149 RepID=A0A2P2JX36_RHIMU